MNYSRLSRVSDSLGSQKPNKSRTRRVISDSLRKKLMDTESTEEFEEVAVDAMSDEGQAPEEVLSTVVDVLNDVIEDLETEVSDSKKALRDARVSARRAARSNRTPMKDAAQVRKLKAAFRKKLMDTETTTDVVDEAVEQLKVMDPVSVIETVVEVLDDAIDNLSNEKE